MNHETLIRDTLSEARSLLDKILDDKEFQTKISESAELIAHSFQNGGKVLSCGNGGSHCDAMHFAEELTGRFRDDRKSLPAICISDASHISCVGNDYGFNYIFSRFIEGVGNNGDVLFALTTSGNSQNIIEAVRAARERNMKVILLTGKDGGKLSGQADVELIVPHFGYADRIQEIHIKVIHIIIQIVEKLA